MSAVCVAVCVAMGVLQCVWCCSEIPLYAIYFGSVCCSSVVVRFFLQCVLQWVCCRVCCSVCCSGVAVRFFLQSAHARERCVAVRVAECVAVGVAVVLQCDSFL